MGGSAFVLYGTVDESVLDPAPVKKTFFDRLLGRQRFEGPRETSHGNTKTIDLPLGRLGDLKSFFMKYLKNHLIPISEASKNILEYLDLDVMRINFRGHKRAQDEKMEWSIQVTFSGCAGMAETSASLSAHWVRLWYLKNRSELQKEIFSGSGFSPCAPEDDESEVFLPLPQGGYARYYEDPQEMYVKDEELAFHFEIDDSFLEAQADGGVELMNQIESEYLSVMADGRCRCQLCTNKDG
jgi:hypothetical protein